MVSSSANIPNYLISPGYIYLPNQQTKISAVLGSCVSITIYDNKLKIGGMNHFLYPQKQIDDERKSIFGDISTKTLINMFLKLGSKKENLEAQIFGGAYNSEFSLSDIGKENINTAKEVLKNNRIKIASWDTGGDKGRKIIFNSSTNEIVIIRVENLRQTDWFPYK